jgi:hypothetical protein
MEVETLATTSPARSARLKPFYVTLPGRIVQQADPETFLAASGMVGLCLEHLECEPVPVRWIMRVSGAQAGAIVEAGQAASYGLHRIDHGVSGTAGSCIRLAIFGEDPLHTAAHEARHVWQGQTGRHHRMSYQEEEEDADAYAAAAVERWGDRLHAYASRQHE